MNREILLKMKCVKQPDTKQLVTDITVGNIYEIEQVDTDDFLLVDDKKNTRWYLQDLFERVDLSKEEE